MKIDFEKPQTTIVSKKFEGSTDGGVNFTVYASFSVADDEWEIDSVDFENWDERTDELESEVSEFFYSEVYN